jgi:hypothetical protein
LDQLQACDLFGELSTAELRSLFPEDASPTCTGNVCNERGVLVFFLAAGCSLSGQLDDCDSLADLKAAFNDFTALWSGGIIGDEQWNDTATDILQQAEACALQLAMQMGDAAQRNSKFSPAELN